MTKISDEQAQELLENATKVHLELLKKTHTNWELSTSLGISAEDVSKAIHTLRNQNFIQYSHHGKERYYSLTPLGRASAPPPPLPDFQGADCDPRKKNQRDFLKPNHPHISGSKHFVGIAGKWKVDENGAVILGADTNHGRVYKVLHEHPSLVADLPEKTGISQQPIYNACSTLVKMGLIERMFIEGKSAYRATATPCVLSDGSLATNKAKGGVHPKPAKIAPIKPDVLVTQAVQDSPSKDVSIDQAVTALIEEYGASDVMMSVMAYIDDNLNQYQQLKRVMERARI